MDCDRVRELLSDYLEEALADGDRADVAAHLDGCPRCAAEAAGLSETIALLSSLPPEKAPPELLGRIMGEIRREAAGPPRHGSIRSPLRVRIPLEAAAAVILLVLVYGIQRGMPVRSALPERGGERPQAASTPVPDVAPPPPAPPPSPRTAAREPRAAAREPSVLPPATVRAESRAAAPSPSTANTASTESAGHPGGAASAGNTAAAVSLASVAPPAPALPGVTVLPAAAASRVSQAEETIEPKVFAAPPSRMLKAVPYGREVTLEVASSEREGIEERIVAAAQRLGGGVPPGVALRAERAQPFPPDTVRVHLPRESAGAFIDALGELGTIPPEGMPASVDLPAGPAPGITAYTVRIRVR